MNKCEFETFPTFIDDLHVKLCDPVVQLLRIRLHPVIFVILLSVLSQYNRVCYTVVLCHSTLGALKLYTLL